MFKLRRLVATAMVAFISTQAVAAVTYFHNDISGTPILATDASGAVLWKENYRPYGDKFNNQAAGATNKIGFHGRPYDNNTALSYMGARYYDPLLGRFTGMDPVDFQEDNVHSFNRYAYANNNPYKYVDPDGTVGFLALALPLLRIGLVANEIATSDVPILGGSLVKSSVKTVEGAVAKTASQVTTNAAAGAAAEVRAATELVAEGSAVLGSRVAVRTNKGLRVIDHLTETPAGQLLAVEVKAGNATRNAAQVAKDKSMATEGGVVVGKNAPDALRGQKVVIPTVVRRY